MRKLCISSCFMLICLVVLAQNTTTTASLRVKAFEQIALSGAPKNPIVEVGGKEVAASPNQGQPTYFIYLIANKVPYIKIERVWIKQKLYTATIEKIKQKPVVLKNGKMADTLVRYTDEAVWQLILKDAGSTDVKPKKDIASLVAANELVLRLNDKDGKTYTRSVKKFTRLEPFKGI